MSMLFLGIAAGVVAAFMQSCSYLGGRRFLAMHGNAQQLLFASLIINGIAAFIMAPFFLEWKNLCSWQIWFYMLICDGGLILGNWGFFSAQKYIESSRIASLMGLKVILVTLLSMIFLGANFIGWQYVAIILTAFAAMLMNWSKGKLDWNGMGFLMVALTGYAVSDLGVQLVVKSFNTSDPIRNGMCGFALCYGIGGVVSLGMIKPCKISWQMVKGAFPQAICWVVSMWGLYVCFGLLGAAFGNVIQASRGVISLVLGIVLSYFAIQGLEQKQSALVWLRKAVAAILMFGAIVLYAFSAKG